MTEDNDKVVEILGDIDIHEESRKIYESVVTPEHDHRVESSIFKQSKKRLREDGHYKCWVCGSTNDLQAHHYAAEWSLAEVVDFDKLKAFCEEWDPYGYGKLLKNIPMTSVDDVRNILMLCQTHHTGVNHENENSGTGIHSLSFSAFVIQKIAKDGQNPIPQPGQDADDMIKLAEEKEKQE